MTASYKQYFIDTMTYRFGAQHIPSVADVMPLVAEVETSLRQKGYDEAVIASELLHAKKAAAELVSQSAPSQLTPDSKTATAPGGRNQRYGTRALIVLGFMLVYFTPLAMFFSESGNKLSVTVDGADLSLALRISVVDLARDTVTFQITPSGGQLIGPNGKLTKDVTVETDPGTGSVSHVFKADMPLTPWTVTATADSGDILEFPFDSYEVDLDVQAQSGGKTVRVKTGLTHVPHGLRATHQETAINDGGTNVIVHVRRTGTIMFVALLAAMSLLLVTGAACLVAWQVVYRGRKIEFSMMVWVAALLFVIPTVRNSLPGSVPPGALIDFLLFFWLQVAAVTAMASLVLTWTRRVGT